MEKYSDEESKIIFAMIEKAYKALDSVFESSWTNHAQKCFELALIAERQHRRSNDACPYRIKSNLAARLFVVKWAAYAFYNPKFLTIESVIRSTEHSVYAFSMGLNFEKEIKAVWKDFDLEELAKLDYSKLT